MTNNHQMIIMINVAFEKARCSGWNGFGHFVQALRVDSTLARIPVNLNFCASARRFGHYDSGHLNGLTEIRIRLHKLVDAAN